MLNVTRWKFGVVAFRFRFSCVYVYVWLWVDHGCICMYVYMYVCVCVCGGLYISTCVCKHLLSLCILTIYIYIYIYIIMVDIWVGLYWCIYIYIYIYKIMVDIRVGVYIYIYIYIYSSLYWGMLIYFLSWNLLDVVHSYLTCYVGCICCFCFSLFGHSYLHQWLTGCVSECYVLERIAHCRRWLVQFLH